MILEQHYLACLAQASYLIGDEETKVAVVVDPRRDVEVYLERARELGLTIRHVILTHFHADFLAGHLELRERTGAQLHLGAKATAEYDFAPLADGDALELGTVRIEVLETPGHTPESISLVVYDARVDAAAPHAVLTGDALFIGDVGRPDLMASVGLSAGELAGMLYDSLHQKLLKLPDSTLVYPGHGAGSMCGKNLSTDTVSTIGAQRVSNYALKPMEKAEFVATLTADQPQAPAYFSYDAELNRSEHATLTKMLAKSLQPLALEEVLRLENGGAQLLDCRSSDEHAAGHLAGAVNIGLDGRFATWCGTLLDNRKPIVVIAAPGKEDEAVVRLGRIGFDRVAGFLEGGMDALQGRPDLIRKTPRALTEELRRELTSAEPPCVVDVRTPGERDQGGIPGSLHVPLSELSGRLDEIPRDRELILVCKSGYRSSSAASLLRSRGIAHVSDLKGGMDAWGGKQPETESCAV